MFCHSENNLHWNCLSFRSRTNVTSISRLLQNSVFTDYQSPPGDCEASAGLPSKILKLIVILSKLCTRSVGRLNENRSHRRCYFRRFELSWYYLNLQGQTVYEVSFYCSATPPWEIQISPVLRLKYHWPPQFRFSSSVNHSSVVTNQYFCWWGRGCLKLKEFGGHWFWYNPLKFGCY